MDEENTQAPVEGGEDQQDQNAGTPTENTDQGLETTAGDGDTTGEAEAPEDEEPKQTW